MQSPSLWNVTCAHGWQDGGGLYIYSSGTATLTNTNVYENQASAGVCLHVELYQSVYGNADLYQRVRESG